jgi:hypothetical protein
MKIKLTANKKHQYIKLNRTRYFVFKVGSLPNHFAEITSEAPVRSWLNYKGYTLINEAYLTESFTLR